MCTHVLMIEDDEGLSAMVAEYLSPFDMEVTAATTVADGMRLMREQSFNLLLLDVMLPDGDGFEVCRQVHNESDVPILMLTARGDETDRIVGLELGADDYLPKPFNPRELLACMRAIIRRRTAPGVPAAANLHFGRLEIDRNARVARVDGQPRELTSHQFDLLWALAENAGRVMSRDTLMNWVRGHDVEAFDRSIDVHISRIRTALEDDPKQPRRILTVRGAG